MIPRILVFGSGGQVGSSLVQQASQDPGCLVDSVDMPQLDLTDTNSIAPFIHKMKPDWVVNAAAYTAVDRAEDDAEAAHVINADAPGAMAAACAEMGAGFIHYSTDYVFSGESSRPYRETDETDPRSVYGATKLAGEKQALAGHAGSIILRTAWVYSREGANFVNTMLRLAGEREQINVVNDQHGTPTLAADLAALALGIITQSGSGYPGGGIYHATSAGQTTWFEFCREIFALAGVSGVNVNPVTTSEYPTRATRPAYSVLDNSKLHRDFGISLPHWKQSLAHCLAAEGPLLCIE